MIRMIIKTMACVSICLAASVHAVPAPESEIEWPNAWIAGPAKICYGGISLNLKKGEKVKFPKFEPVHPYTIVFGNPPSSSKIILSESEFFITWPGNARAMNEANMKLSDYSIVEENSEAIEFDKTYLVKPKFPKKAMIRPEFIEAIKGEAKDEAPPADDPLQIMTLSFSDGHQKQAMELLSRFIIEPKPKDCRGPKWPLDLTDAGFFTEGENEK